MVNVNAPVSSLTLLIPRLLSLGTLEPRLDVGNASSMTRLLTDCPLRIGDTEGDEVAWCTKPGHGTRIIPNGAITGIQLIQTPSYIQIAGTINQAMLNVANGDPGGQMDSSGADGEGNPMGGLVYTNAFPSSGGNNATYVQSRHWSL
jgi:hypothetical protein